jgi:hypothetical protein
MGSRRHFRWHCTLDFCPVENVVGTYQLQATTAGRISTTYRLKKICRMKIRAAECAKWLVEGETPSVRQETPGLRATSRANARPQYRLTATILAEAREQRRKCFDVDKRGAEVHDAGSQREFSIDNGVGQECFATSLNASEQRLVDFIDALLDGGWTNLRLQLRRYISKRRDAQVRRKVASVYPTELHSFSREQTRLRPAYSAH